MRVVRSAADLRELVGQELGVGDWVEVSQRMVDDFADATDDHQWIHVDPERAATGPFGRTIAHGWLSASLLPSLGRGAYKIESRMAVNYGVNRIRFTNPVPVGFRIRGRFVLKDVAEIAGGVQITLSSTVEIEGVEKPAVVAETLGRHYW
jgi:acyl dehydratase